MVEEVVEELPPFEEEVVEEAIEEIRRIATIRHELSFDIDGAVIKVDEFSKREAMGTTSKYPKWAVAFKYPPEEKESRITDIEVTVGRRKKRTKVFARRR